MAEPSYPFSSEVTEADYTLLYQRLVYTIGLLNDAHAEIESLEEELLDWRTSEIFFTRKRTVPFYYTNPTIDLTISTTLQDGSPAFVKRKSVATTFYYVPEWHNADWPSSDYDIGILNQLLRCSIFVVQEATHNTVVQNQELRPIFMPNSSDMVYTPNYAQLGCLKIDTSSQWMYSKIRIWINGDHFITVASERDHNWWWFETRNDVPDII